MVRKLMEDFGISGKDAVKFYNQIQSYWMPDNCEYLPNGVSVGKSIFRNDKEFRFLHINDVTLYLECEKTENGIHIYGQLHGNEEKREKAKTLLEIMSSVEIK